MNFINQQKDSKLTWKLLTGVINQVRSRGNKKLFIYTRWFDLYIIYAKKNMCSKVSIIISFVIYAVKNEKYMITLS